MSEQKHTKGPWRYAFDGHGGVTIETDDCDGVQIGFVSRGSEANARLVAASPELLEALILLEKEMVLSGNAESRDYGWKPAIEKTRAAIAKATGR